MMNYMRKDIIPVVIIGILAVLGLFLIKQTMITGQYTQNHVSTPKLKGKVTIEKNIISDNSASIKYEIEASYPEVRGLSHAHAQKAINEQSYQLVENSITKFKNELSAAQQVKNIPQSVFSQTSQFTLSYEVGESTEQIVSYHYSQVQMIIGMAHPANTNQTQNFDSQTGKLLTLADIFQPNTNYLATLSQITSQELTMKLGTQNGEAFFIKQGTAPTAENFKNFLITPHGLEIIFDPATVAADFAGTQTVLIPMSKLSSILNPLYFPQN